MFRRLTLSHGGKYLLQVASQPWLELTRDVGGSIWEHTGND